MHFIIIDDSQTTRIIIRQMVRDAFEGCVIDEAVDGDDAKSKLLKKEYDLAILDIDMPKMSGLALMKEMKRLRPAQRFLIVSSLSGSHYFNRAVELGAEDYISKGLETKLLVDAARAILKKK